ncbi:MAG TPA: hypothetical protein VNS34_22980 [Rhizobiaceae bacterium]|nr:hypothetical protein [Rhizobiaceae bacterium]
MTPWACNLGGSRGGGNRGSRRWASLAGALNRLGVLAAILWWFAAAAPAHGVGIERLEVTSLAGERLPVTIFYPAIERYTPLPMGPYDVLGKPGAAWKTGLFPLIVISHGTSASMLSHHDSASYLALNGFIVAAVEHAGDNYRDTSGLGKLSTAYRRASHISTVVDYLLATPYGRQIDRDRIGVIGFSSGTVTALMLAGAEPDFGRLAAYCRDRVRATGLCEGGGKLAPDRAVRGVVADERIGAALLLAPIGVLFDSAQLSRIRIPVGIIFAGEDAELSLEVNVRPLADHLANVEMIEMIPLAGHMIFLAPCTDRMAAEAKAICDDPPLVDREREHSLLNAMALSFFRQAFEAVQAHRQ